MDKLLAELLQIPNEYGMHHRYTIPNHHLKAAFIIARVYCNFMRVPTPYGPPVHPVLTSQTLTPASFIFLLNISAYLVGCNGINGAPKQAEKEGTGSTTPASVPAIFAV